MNRETEVLLNEILSHCKSNEKTKTDQNFNLKFEELFNSAKDLSSKSAELNIIALLYNLSDDVTELIFDLLLFDFFSDSNKHDENYFESKEWIKTEEKIIDRGTELFNILLYLRECADNDFEISLDDYIDEYLMCEDDLENLEAQYYEDILKNREILQNADISSSAEIAKQNTLGPLENQLLPILMFFSPENNNDKKIEIIETAGENPVFQKSFLSILNTYKNFKKLKHEFISN